MGSSSPNFRVARHSVLAYGLVGVAALPCSAWLTPFVFVLCFCVEYVKRTQCVRLASLLAGLLAWLPELLARCS